jgi:hypothetical protein
LCFLVEAKTRWTCGTQWCRFEWATAELVSFCSGVHHRCPEVREKIVLSQVRHVGGGLLRYQWSDYSELAEAKARGMAEAKARGRARGKADGASETA